MGADLAGDGLVVVRDREHGARIAVQAGVQMRGPGRHQGLSPFQRSAAPASRARRV